MRKVMVSQLWLVTMVLTVVIGCAPTAAPTPAPIAASPTIAPIVAPTATPALSTEAAAWQKVIEAAQKEGKLTLYSYAFTGDLGLALTRGFKQRYGITIEIISGRGAEMGERIKTEQRIKAVVADIQEGASTHNLNSKKAGSSVATVDIPAFREPKSTWFATPLSADPEGHVIAYGLTVYTPYINTQLVKTADIPQSFRDFLAPQWKGKILASDPNLSTTEYNHFVPLLDAKILDEDFLRSVGKQNLQFVLGETERGEKLGRGVSPLTMTGSTATIPRFIGAGAPIRAVRMKEAVVGNTISMVRIKNGPHPNAAHVFINWLLSKEGQDIHGKERFMGSIRRDGADYTPEPARSDLTGLLVMSAEQESRTADLLREKWLSKLWQK